jgi:hypothetical protein
MDTVERNWAVVWGVLIAALVAAEVVAIRSGNDKAPMSHHLRRYTHRLGKSTAGQVALHIGAGWLHRHLYQPIEKELK